MRVGVLGGTFDPIHYGHLKIASLGLRMLSLNEILFVPARDPWMKKQQKISPLVDREKMLAIALKGFSFFKTHDEPETEKGSSYSINLVSHILNQNRYKNSYLFLFVGDDHLESLSRWKDVDKLLSTTTLVYFSRKINKNKPVGVHRSSGEIIGVPGAKILEISTPPLHISGYEVRKKMRGNCPVSLFSTRGVAEYIRARKLYKT
jgi:nicotinate-nucleotide adenylyltransferase